MAKPDTLLQKILRSEKTDKYAFRVAVVGLFGLLYLLFFFSNPQAPVTAEEVGTLTTSGTVRRRHSRSLVWRDISGDNKIFMRDFIYTPPGQSARVVLGGSKVIELLPNTMVQFDNYSMGSIEINLIAGKVKGADGVARVKQPAKDMHVYWKETKLLEYLPNLDALSTRQSELMDRLLAKINQPPPIVAMREPKFKPYTLNSLSHFELALIEPQKGRNLKIAQGEWIDALWTPIPLPGVLYEVQLSQTTQFDYYVAYQTRYHGISLQLQEPAQYYWRVIAKLPEKKEQEASATSNFLVDVSFTAGKKLSFLNRLPDTTARYTVEVSATPGFEKVLVRQVASKPECPQTGLPRGAYFCRVRDSKTDELLKEFDFKVPSK